MGRQRSFGGRLPKAVVFASRPMLSFFPFRST
jgi:hypothetical protein